MVGTGRFELPTPRTPSDFRTIDADCYCLLNFTTVISLHASCNPTELLLNYAIFDLGSPQKSPQSPRPWNAIIERDLVRREPI